MIDIAVIITEDTIPAACDSLVTAGYTALGIMDVPGRWAFRQPGYRVGEKACEWWTKGDEMRRLTYVTIDGCLSFRNHLDLKNTSLTDEKLRKEYGDVKENLVSGGVKDVDEYCVGKDEIILKILRTAGWNGEELDEVRKVNPSVNDLLTRESFRAFGACLLGISYLRRTFPIRGVEQDVLSC